MLTMAAENTSPSPEILYLATQHSIVPKGHVGVPLPGIQQAVHRPAVRGRIEDSFLVQSHFYLGTGRNAF